jgi:dihydrodipicolinate synthase/N-acetylneuraminate lyase
VTHNRSIELAGVIPVLPTPFRETGEVDEASFRKVIDAAIADGAHGLAMFGLASEVFKLADAEKVHLTKILVDQCGKRVPVIVSITHHSLEVARREAMEAIHMGADALMIMPPFVMSPSLESVQSHIATIAADTTAPVIVQYAPIQTGASLNVEFIAALQRNCPNLAYVKVDSVPAGPMISKLRSSTGERVKAMVGYMGLHLPADFARGAVAVMPTVSLVRAFVEMLELLARDRTEGRAMHERLLPLLNFMMQSVEMLIAVEKHFLHRRGLVTSTYCRSPNWAPDAFYVSEMDRLWSDLCEFLQASDSMKGMAS